MEYSIFFILSSKLISADIISLKNTFEVINRSQMNVISSRSFDQLTETFNQIVDGSGYGCWCDFSENTETDTKNHKNPEPVDFFDENCKELHQGYDCAQIDGLYESLSDGLCLSRHKQVNSIQVQINPYNKNALKDACTEANFGDLCGIRVCMIEHLFVARLVEELSIGYLVGGGIENAFLHENSPGFKENHCSVDKHGGSASVAVVVNKKQVLEKDRSPYSDKYYFTDISYDFTDVENFPVGKNLVCCGEYPIRFPYDSMKHDCCVDSAYNPVSKECCSDGTVSLIGDC